MFTWEAPYRRPVSASKATRPTDRSCRFSSGTMPASRQEPWASTTQTNGSESIVDEDPCIARNSLLRISRTTGEWGLPVTETSGMPNHRYANPNLAANRFEILGPPSVDTGRRSSPKARHTENVTAGSVMMSRASSPDSSQKARTTDVPSASSPSEKHGWRVFGGMMGPVQ